jgi:serine/threonine protein kinase
LDACASVDPPIGDPENQASTTPHETGAVMRSIRQADAEPIPGYRLIEPLGSGGFGEVWKCEAPGGLFKAIKFVYGNLNSLDVDGVRAEQELHALERIKEVRHPFVLSLDRIEVVNGELVIVMELADKSLHDAYVECQTAGLVGIPRDGLLRYIRDAAEALDHMNDKHNLQHLDIKPRNLFLISDRVKVADFGLVKHLERPGNSGLLGGVTPLYAPPETFSGKISETSDQYSLAIVYEELLTGQRPFSGKNARQLAQQHLQEEPELRSLPEAERPVVARALAKEPSKRFPNCLAFVRALYTAQGRVRSEPVLVEAAAGASSQRPKTLHETLEDIQLEGLPDGPSPDDSPAGAEAEEVSRLGITQAQPETGALRPTLVIGVGAFGRRALRELRCRFLDHLGDLKTIPLLRFLYVDPDLEATQVALRGTPEVAFSRNEVCHVPLQPVGSYRRRMLDHLNEWLPREKLYSMPRSLQTQGSRALGRLAFVDNYLRLLARVRREVQQATHPDSLYQSVSQSGLALRDSLPRIYVLAAAGGGGSGLLVDLGYGLRRLLQQLRYPEAEVNLLLFCGAPTDPATPRSEQANVYATLTELNHFADPTIPFSAQYGADGPRLVDHGQPFSATYLLQLSHRSPAALRDAVAHLGSYLFHELTTPLGLRLDRCRHRTVPAGATIFRSFGTYAVWFPRGLLLRLAARQACQQLIEEWQAVGEPTAQAEVEAACARVLADIEVRAEALASEIETAASAPLGGTPAEALTSLLTKLEEQSQQSVALEDPENWARQALSRVREFVGSGTMSDPAGQASNSALGDWRKSRLSRVLTAAAEQVAREWEGQLASAAVALMEHPGRRLAAAEAALERFIRFCREYSAAHGARRNQQVARTQQACQQLEQALETCIPGGERNAWGLSASLLFGNRSRRSLRVLMDHLAAFARQCLAEEIIAADQCVFDLLSSRLNERLRDLGFCRQRLRHLQENFDLPVEEASEMTTVHLGVGVTPAHSPVPSAESFWESIRQSATIQVILPEGETDLECAAAHFASLLSQSQKTQLDQVLQDGVLAALGGLHTACAGSTDLARSLAMPLVDQAASFLSEQLPVTDVAQFELAAGQATQTGLSEQIEDYLSRATPMVAGAEAGQQDSFLLVPASPSGKAFGEAAQKLVKHLHVVRVPGQAHLMFACEQGYLSAEDLQGLIRPCQAAYEEASMVPQASPHTRFDIIDWVPLDP